MLFWGDIRGKKAGNEPPFNEIFFQDSFIEKLRGLGHPLMVLSPSLFNLRPSTESTHVNASTGIYLADLLRRLAAPLRHHDLRQWHRHPCLVGPNLFGLYRSSAPVTFQEVSSAINQPSKLRIDTVFVFLNISIKQTDDQFLYDRIRESGAIGSPTYGRVESGFWMSGNWGNWDLDAGGQKPGTCGAGSCPVWFLLDTDWIVVAGFP
ncbi:MAG: hypothetical protein MJE63_12675, partial [Proteobacteria bacterium]|nr:hypothetical protein [Pseudomonadota bacterium]